MEYAKHHARNSSGPGSKKAAETYTGYDPSGKGHSMRRSPSTVASSSATVAPRSNFARIKVSRSPTLLSKHVKDAEQR